MVDQAALCTRQPRVTSLPHVSLLQLIEIFGAHSSPTVVDKGSPQGEPISLSLSLGCPFGNPTFFRRWEVETADHLDYFSGNKEMGENYGRTELEAIIKSHQQQHHHFLSHPSCAPPTPVHGLHLPEMVVENPFRFTGFFQDGMFGTQQHHLGMSVAAVGEEEEEVAGTHQDMECGFYPSRMEFCSTNAVPTSIAENAGNLHGASADGDLLLSVRGERRDNSCAAAVSDNNVRQCPSSSPSGKMEETQGGGDAGNTRWSRHETLTLLELRAKLDSKFREATQKGPLWEEVSREMAEGYGYHRSGKKCREKFENLYKYYKKSKEGRTGRQDGKNYRFYAQLEALCGGDDGKDTKNNLTKNTEFDVDFLKEGAQANKTKAIDEKFLNSPEFIVPTTSSGASEEGQLGNGGMTKEEGRNWKKKIKSYMEKQMRRFMDRQEEWFDRILKSLERQEEERLAREKAWRKEETDRLQKEHEFWAKERAWTEARDAKLMESLRKMIGEDCTTNASSSPHTQIDTHELQAKYNTESNVSGNNSKRWLKCEILSLIRLKMTMEVRCEQGDSSIWEEIAMKMRQLGCNKSGQSCKEKWENISKYFTKSKEFSKKRKEISFTGSDMQYIDALYDNEEMNVSHEISFEGELGTLTMGADASSEGMYRD